MAAPVYVTASQTIVSNASSGFQVVNMPTGMVAGDIVIAHFAARATTAVWSVPAGSTWQRIPFTLEINGSNANATSHAFWKAITSPGTEPASYTFGSSVATVSSGISFRVTGADTTNPIDNHGANQAASGVSNSVASFAIAGDERLLLGFGNAATGANWTAITATHTVTYNTGIGSGQTSRAPLETYRALTTETVSGTFAATGSATSILQLAAIAPAVAATVSPTIHRSRSDYIYY